MFQRFRTAIDRTIAEEQARQKAAAEQRSASPSGAPQRTSSTASKRKAKKPSQDISNSDNLPNPDPAIFEAAFVLDEEEAEAKATAEKSETAGSASNMKDGDKDLPSKGENGSSDGSAAEKGDRKSEDKSPKDAPATSSEPELPADVQTKLKKLEKLEKTYPGECSLSDTSHLA